MSGALGVLVVPAPVVLVVRTLVVARPVSSPGTHAIHRLSTATSGTLLVVIGVGAARAAVRSTLGVLVVPAPPVGTSGLVARPVSSPGTHAIHRLGAPRGGALPVVIAVGAARAIVSGVLGDLVRPAALVLGALQGPPVFTEVAPVTVVLAGAASIAGPVPRAVHGLGAARSRTRLVVVAVGASRAAVGGVLGHLVGLAPQVPLRGALIVARPVSGPVPRTVHRLRTARGRARGRHVAVGAARAAVRGAPGVLVVSAPPVGASGLVAPAVGAPRSGAVHRLGATRGGAGVLTVAVPAASSTIGGVGRVNVLAALPVLAARLVAPAVRRPVPGTVHGLGAPRLSAILVPVAVGASGPTVRSGGGVHVVPALLAAAAGPEARPVPRAVRCLGAAAGGALSVPVAVGATGTSVRGGGGVHVVPALLAAGAAAVARPVPRAVLGLWAAAGGALGLPGSRAQQAPTRGLRLLVPEFGVVHGRLLQGAPFRIGFPVKRAVIVPPRVPTTKPTVPSVRVGSR